MKVLIFDTETTDVNGYVIEICAAVIDFNENTGKFCLVDSYASAVNPNASLNPVVKRIFKIEEDALQAFPTFKEIWIDKLEKLFKTSDLVVAHNIPFDLSVLQREFDRYELESLKTKPKDYAKRNCFCTCNDTVSLFKKRLKLQELGWKLYVSKREVQSLLEEITENVGYNPSAIRTKTGKLGFHTAVGDTAYTCLSFARLYSKYKRLRGTILKRKKNPAVL
jgi:DNA polymerase III epsilon subunit-like protein